GELDRATDQLLPSRGKLYDRATPEWRCDHFLGRTKRSLEWHVDLRDREPVAVVGLKARHDKIPVLARRPHLHRVEVATNALGSRHADESERLLDGAGGVDAAPDGDQAPGRLERRCAAAMALLPTIARRIPSEAALCLQSSIGLRLRAHAPLQSVA